MLRQRSDPAAPVLPLRLLLVEDTDDDAALVVRAVRNAGFEPSIVRAQTADEFRAALASAPDLVISDYSLPSFGAVAALACLQAEGLELPFIVVSGTIDEDAAISILRAGAHDFVTKQNLARLGPAIRRELQEARTRAERRNARRDLRVQRDFLRLVIDVNPSLVFAKNWQGVFTLANRAVADLYGTTVNELVGKTDEHFYGRDDGVTERLRGARDVMATGQPRSMPCQALKDAGTREVRWFDIRMVPLLQADGEPQVLGIGTEITQRRLAEQALRVSEEQFRQAQKMEAVGQLAGGIAHDFNNLLGAILGYSELVLERVTGVPDLVADVEQIRRAALRAGSLTSQMLAFSRTQVLAPQVLNLNEVVASVAKMLRRVIGENICLQTVLAPALNRVTVDPGQIEQVLLNLAINARDAMPQGGTLTIETANTASSSGSKPAGADQCVSLAVTDTGTGMPPEVRTRIFEPFFTTKGPDKGTGLGLSMVYGVVTQSGGTIEVDSEHGQGTCFTIRFPAAKDAVKQAAVAAPPQTDRRGTETILLVEDELVIRELVRRVLTGYGYRVLEAADTNDAVQIADRYAEPIHVLLTDIVMPDASGPDLALRLVPLRPEMRVLFMSGFGNRLPSGFGALTEAVSVLHKPFTPEGLADKVRECLNGAPVPTRARR